MFCFTGSITLLPTMSNPSRSLQLTLPSPVPMGLTSVFSVSSTAMERKSCGVGSEGCRPSLGSPRVGSG